MAPLLFFTTRFLDCQKLLPLWQARRQITLNFSPARLSGYDVVVVLTVFLLRSIWYSISTKWMKVRNGKLLEELSRPSTDHALSLCMPLRTSQGDIDAFSLAVREASKSGFPSSNVDTLLFLSAVSEPAMLLLLAQKHCKVRPLGSVNVRNRFELLRPDLCTPQYLRSFNGAVLNATCSKVVRKVKRGFEIDLTVSVDVPSGQDGSFTTMFRQIFTILQFANVQADVSPFSSVNSDPNWLYPLPFRVNYDEPSFWARVCKDYNPIHTSTIAAKAFGFPGKIAHGNHVAAKAFDVLTKSASAPSCIGLSHSQEPLWMEVMFRRPVIVPAQLETTISQSTLKKDGTSFTAFEILNQSKVCIEGKFGKL